MNWYLMFALWCYAEEHYIVGTIALGFSLIAVME
jgi:hypothetical protein